MNHTKGKTLKKPLKNWSKGLSKKNDQMVRHMIYVAYYIL